MRRSRTKIGFAQAMERVPISQAGFARMIGVAPTTINRWCTAREDSLRVPRVALVVLTLLELLAPADRAKAIRECGLLPGARQNRDRHEAA